MVQAVHSRINDVKSERWEIGQAKVNKVEIE